MELPLFRKIIDESTGYVHSVNLHHRGEPLLNKDLPEMINYCRERGIFSQLHTNATLLSEDKSYALVRAGLNLISFSIDGYDKASYESIRIGADFESTIENIKRFMQIRNQLRSKMPFAMMEVIDFYGSNKEKIHAIREMAHQIKPDKLIIKKAHNWAGEFPLDQMEISSDRPSTGRRACAFPWYALTILWDGTAVSCPQDFFRENAIGNLNETTLEGIWNHRRQIYFRDKIKKKRLQEIHACRFCDRPGRAHVLGIPTSHLKAFLNENL